MDTKERIITTAQHLFMYKGVRSVTMDDISRELGMSKKTLYQYFGNKAEIVEGVTDYHFHGERCLMEEIQRSATDPLDVMVQSLKAFAKSFRDIPTNMIHDVQKYYPKSWARFHSYKTEYVLPVMRKNLKAGVEAGLYRKDMDLELVAKLRLEQIEMVLDPIRFPPQSYDIGKVQIEQYALFLHGIVTMKGKQLIYKYLNQPEDE
ncbi:MAG: TetR/AcrR family transcriptional regulator [Bacteroidota bacterium]